MKASYGTLPAGPSKPSMSMLDSSMDSSGEEPGIFDDRSLRWRAGGIIAVLVAVNVVVLVALFIVGRTYPPLISPGILAYSFGLRHAVDADHIATIDNVTRKLIQDGKRPITVGLWFSLGHSTVVVILAVLVAFGSTLARNRMESAQAVGSIIGVTVSATMLILIGGINLYSGVLMLRAWSRVSDGSAPSPHEQLHTDNIAHAHEDGQTEHTHLVAVDREAEVSGGGFFTKCCPMMFKSVDTEWKMYPIGLLFGLGFDTASEVTLLALAAMGANKGIPPACIVLLPLSFTAGMSLLDTLDGMVMMWAYGWALKNPARKLFYNMFLTVSSGLVALAVAAVEILGTCQEQLELQGPFWNGVRATNDNFEVVGYCIVGFFVGSAGVAMLSFRCYFGPQLKAAEEAATIRFAVEEATERKRQEDYVKDAMVALAMAPPKIRDDDDAFF